MKRIFIFCFFVLSLTVAKGQYVLIPDSNFRHALVSQGFATCFDTTLTMLDTTCSAVLDSTLINVANKNIRSIEGIQYFKQLHSFACDSNPLYTLPVFPNSTSYLSCQYDSLTALPELPTSLYLLYCFHNQLDSLPALPNGVRWLDVANNNLLILPALPPSVYGLISSNNRISIYPTLPTGLYNLDCGNNPITVLPVLPAALHILSCYSTGRDSLPPLPDSLQILNCQYNNLAFLPLIPSTLHVLNCSNNQLIGLPPLPDSLVSLDCSSNQLTSIPSLPDSMFSFSCGSNPQLNCLPELKRIVQFNFDGTAITCLPDTGNITNSNPSINSLPLCGANGCTTTGIHEENLNSLQVYPNPVTDILYINYPMQNGTCTITDITGRIVTLLSPNLDKQINVSALQSGVYVLQIQTGSGNVMYKFLKE